VRVAGASHTGCVITTHSSRSGTVGLACLAVLMLPGCGEGGGSAYEPAPLSVGTTGAIETKGDGLALRSNDFSFTVPKGWAKLAASSARSWGDVASASSVAPKGAAPSSLVFVLAYDVTGQPEESADGPRAWFDWYARTNEAQVREPLHVIELDRSAAWRGSLRWTDDADNPVEVEIVRAVRGDVIYLIQCQAEPVDRTAIAAGCARITESFHAT
jgi:hypothetical protein